MPWERQFNKDEVLNKALQAFWQRGYEATSMQELVDCTGINRGSLYATYGDKRALFQAALARYDGDRRQMLASLEARYSPREAIGQLFHAFTKDIDPDGGNKGCFLTNTALELAAHDPEIRAIVAAAQADIEAFFKRMIVAGKNAGELSRHVNPTDASRTLLATLLGVVVLVRSRPERTLLKTIVEDALRRLE